MCATMDILLILIVLLFIVLMWRGPKMLPQLGEALGKTVKGVRQNLNDDDKLDDAADSRPVDELRPVDDIDSDRKPGA